MPKQHSKDYIKEYIESFECKWISGEYINSNSHLLFEFSCGHQAEKSFTAFQIGQRCKICSIEARNKNYIIPKEEIIRRVELQEFKFLGFVGEYEGRSSFISYQCSLGHNTIRKISVFNKNPNCKKCSKERWGYHVLKTQDAVNKVITSMGAKWISGNYKNKNSELLIEFACGHIQKVRYSLFMVRKSETCYDCTAKVRINRYRVPVDTIVQLLKNNNLLFVDFIGSYTGNNTKIKYLCQANGHSNIRTLAYFYNNPYCGVCFKEELRKSYIGENNPMWKGGTSFLSCALRDITGDWYKKSIMFCKYLCVIENKPFEEVHHLYGFNLIMQDAFKELGIVIKSTVADYTNDELILIENKIIEIHNSLLGVCLTKKAHGIFHNLYGRGNNTPSQFEEFQQRIQSGDIIIPE